VSLGEDLERVAAAARAFGAPGEELVAVLPTHADDRGRVYLCAFAAGEERTWVALDARGAAVESRADVRAAVSIAALCELAEESAGGGDLDDLRSQLLALKLRENPPGIDEADEAALALQRTLGNELRVASPSYLDAIGIATRRLERALGEDGASPFANAMKAAAGTVESLTHEVESNYKLELR
jgi:hypothetical protein